MASRNQHTTPKYDSYNGNLTLPLAAEHRNALLQEMDALAISATKFHDKPQVYNSLKDEFNSLKALS